MVSRAKHAHDNFAVRSVSVAKTQLSEALDVVLDILKETTNLKKTIEYRDEALREYDYYNGKVGELLRDKEKTLQNGKQVKPKDQEKLDRNQEKLREKKTEYTRVNEELSNTMYNFLVVRFDKLVPVINTVVSAERKITTGLHESLDAIPDQASSLKAFLGDSPSAHATAPEASSPEITDSAFTVPSMPVRR